MSLQDDDDDRRNRVVILSLTCTAFDNALLPAKPHMTRTCVRPIITDAITATTVSRDETLSSPTTYPGLQQVHRVSKSSHLWLAITLTHVHRVTVT